MHGRDLLPAVVFHVVECKPDDPLGGCGGNRLQAYARTWPDLDIFAPFHELYKILSILFPRRVFDASVEILGVLPHDDEVDLRVPRAHTGVPLGRPETSVKVERLPHGDVDAPESGSNGSGYGSLKRDSILPDRI